MTLKLLEIYVLGFMCALNWIFIWQTTTLKCKFAKLWLFLRRRKAMMYTPTDFEEYAYKNWGLLGELLTCPICYSHWVSGIFSLIICFYFSGDFAVVPFAFFTQPVLIYFILRKYIG